MLRRHPQSARRPARRRRARTTGAPVGTQTSGHPCKSHPSRTPRRRASGERARRCSGMAKQGCHAQQTPLTAGLEDARAVLVSAPKDPQPNKNTDCDCSPIQKNIPRGIGSPARTAGVKKYLSPCSRTPHPSYHCAVAVAAQATCPPLTSPRSARCVFSPS